MSELQRLIDRCKAGVTLSANPHREGYQSVAAYIESQGGAEMMDMDPDERQAVVDAEVLIDLCFFPNSPVGSYQLYGVGADALIAEAHKILDGGG